MYTTGLIDNGTGLFSAIESALIASEWVIHDTINAVDKVYYSTGSDNKSDIYMRVKIFNKCLDFNSQSTNFVTNELVTGATSGATGKIISQTDAGATGTLFLTDVSGIFVLGETITSASGTAIASRPLYSSESVTVSNLDLIFNDVKFITYSYWNNTTHTGLNENAKVGPWYTLPQNASTYLDNYPFVRFYEKLSSGAEDQSKYYDWLNRKLGSLFTSLTDVTDVNGGSKIRSYGLMNSDGYRKLLGVTIPTGSAYYFGSLDLPTYSINYSFSRSLASSNHESIVVHINDTTYVYNLISSGASFFRKNVASGAVEELNPPGVTISSNTAASCWDGNNTIYYFIYNGTTRRIYKYNITGNSWTVTANAGAAGTWNSSSTQPLSSRCAYIKANTISTSAPWNEDRIVSNIKTSPQSSLLFYNVESDTFTESGLALPGNISLGGFNSNSWVCLDDSGKLSVYECNTQGTWYLIDLKNQSEGWKTLKASQTHNGNYALTNRRIFEPYIAKVKWGTNTKYGILCNKNSISIWTKLKNNYYWANAGKIIAVDNSAVTMASIAGGNNVSVIVDTAADLVAGDRITIFNPENGYSLSTTITTIIGNVVTMSYCTALPAGSKISKNSGIGICGDTDFASISTSNLKSKQLYIVNSDNSSSNTTYIKETTFDWPFSTENELTSKPLTSIKTLIDTNNVLTSESIVENSAGDKFIVISPISRFETTNPNKIAIGPLE